MYFYLFFSAKSGIIEKGMSRRHSCYIATRFFAGDLFAGSMYVGMLYITKAILNSCKNDKWSPTSTVPVINYGRHA